MIDSHERIQKFKFSVEIKTLKSKSFGTFCIFYCSFVLWNWDSIHFGVRFDLYFIPYVIWFSYLPIFFQKIRKISRNLTILFQNGWAINNGIFRILVIFLSFFITETYSFFPEDSSLNSLQNCIRSFTIEYHTEESWRKEYETQIGCIFKQLFPFFPSSRFKLSTN